MEDRPERAREPRPRPGRAARALRRWTVAIGIVAAALFASWAGGLVNVGERLFYVPVRAGATAPPGVEDVWFENADGLRLHGWFMPAADADPGGARPVVVHVHGNAGNVGMHWGFSAFLRERGFHVLVFDYRGYGQSAKGPLKRAGLLADTRAAIAYARSRPDVDPGRVGLFGHSLGVSFAMAAAAEDPGVRAVAAVSGFSSWRGVAGDLFPVVGPALVRPGHDPERTIRGLGDRPALIVHGDADEIVSVRHARRLSEAAADAGVNAEVLIVPGGDHNEMLDASPEARDAIGDYFVRTLGPGSP